MRLPDLKFKKPDVKLPKLELGLPSYVTDRLPKRRPSEASASGIRPPKFFGDLYADLRDRRLLPLVALLLVAIAAVPFLLGGGGGEGEAPATGASGATSSVPPTPASFAVVPAEPGLRDYRKRLKHRQARNPFRQPAPPKTESGSSEGAGSEDGSGESSGAGSAGESSGGGAPAEANHAESATVEATTNTVVVQKNTVGYSIDASVGYVEHEKPRKEIKPLTKLPSAKQPIVVFMGLSEDKQRALFLMTSKVTGYYGSGHCALDKQSCALLELQVGKSATFATGFGEAEKRYKVTLDRIVPIVETGKATATVTREGSVKAGGGGSGSTGSGGSGGGEVGSAPIEH